MVSGSRSPSKTGQQHPLLLCHVPSRQGFSWGVLGIDLLFPRALNSLLHRPRPDLNTHGHPVIRFWARRLQGPDDGGSRGGQSLHPPLASFLIGVLFWSGSFSASLLGVLGQSLFSVPLPTSFVLAVCLLPPDLVCVSFLVAVFTSRLCLVCESDNRDSISGRAS